ncbi:phage baseplate assembly protein V [Pseudomonas aeruginosa]|uniref:phage baseplate assembly protein V n=1 Tax=Pseudomonas aeruginosa TaxID=287 RepID=UPI00227CB9E6|nr:phage baseplate assembly protein V [Pseudomonas aeruginosa]WAJ88558.1 phage baseplate assembly protein V [Pseudomonas aeruginosa]
MDVLQRLEELERRVSQMVVRGKIAEVDPDGHVARVEYGPEMFTGWLQWKPPRTGKAMVWWVPEVGEGVTVISEGDLALGEILPGSYHKDFAAPSTDPDLFLVQFGDGSELSYDRRAHLFRLTLAGGRMEVTAPAGVKITGDTEIVGTLHVTESIKGDAEIGDKVRNMSADREIYNVHTHGPSPTPDPQQ